MQIRLSVLPEKHIRQVTLGPYKDEQDDIRSLLTDLCDVISEEDIALFEVSGFGDPAWPVTVATDLPVFLEQLPEAISRASAGENFVLDFYEQGVERRLSFQRSSDSYGILCESSTDWAPDPATEMISTESILAMLGEVRDKFSRLAKHVSPGTASHRWFIGWLE